MMAIYPGAAIIICVGFPMKRWCAVLVQHNAFVHIGKLLPRSPIMPRPLSTTKTTLHAAYMSRA
jgi:hypothetical protein